MPTANQQSPMASFDRLPAMMRSWLDETPKPTPEEQLLCAVQELTEEIRALRREQTGPFITGPAAIAEYRKLTGAAQ